MRGANCNGVWLAGVGAGIRPLFRPACAPRSAQSAWGIAHIAWSVDTRTSLDRAAAEAARKTPPAGAANRARASCGDRRCAAHDHYDRAMSVASIKSPRLDTYNIRLFIAVAEAGSIARAAERENIAASALSRRLSDLEHALRVPLLVRSARGIELTEAGNYVFERGRKIEEDLEEAGPGCLVHQRRRGRYCPPVRQPVGHHRLPAGAPAAIQRRPSRGLDRAQRATQPGGGACLPRRQGRRRRGGWRWR